MDFSIDLLSAGADNYIYLLSDPALGLAMVVDPGDAEVVRRALQKKDLHLSLILNTHHHADHNAGNAKLQHDYGAPVIGPDKEAHRLEGLSRGVNDGDVVSFSDLRAQVIETPGHTTGCVSYYFPEIRALFCGDTLFSLGCGRLFEGQPAQMWESLKKLRDLPEDTLVYCGHEYTEKNAAFAMMLDKDNDALKLRVADVHQKRKKGLPTLPVTLSVEKATNPFLRVDDPTFQKALAKNGIPIDADPAAIFGSLRNARDRFNAA